MDERAAAGAAADDDHVVGAHSVISLRRSTRMILAAASIRARCEKACGKFPRCRAGAGVELLGVQAERRGHVQQLFHQVPGALVLAHDGQRGHEPEGADQEAPLLAGQAVVGLPGAVAQDEAVLGQVVGDRVDRLAQALVVARQEAEDRRQQRGRIQGVGVVVLAEHAVLHAVLQDVGLYLLGGGAPGGSELRAAADLRQLGGAVHGDPAHELGRHVVLRRAAGLPDPLVGIAPDGGGALGLGLHDRPQAPGQPLAVAGVQQDRVEHGAEHVVLALVEGAVADPNRARSHVPEELVARGLGEVAPPVDAVHDLKPAVLVGLEIGHELHELVGLPVQLEPVERLEGEGRVAHPGVAVVPVALTAGRLGQRGGEGGHGGAGRHVGETLDRQGRALDGLAPAVVDIAGAPEPASPEASAWPPSARWPRRCPAASPAPRTRRASSRPGRPASRRVARARGRPRCRSPCPFAAGRSGPPRWRRPCGGRCPPSTTRRGRARSRRPARRPARSPRRPRGRGRCARAGGRRRRRPGAAYEV